MNFLNLGFPEIIFIIIIAIIIFGPNNIVKSANDVGALIRKATKSPYWKEVWATKRDLDEIPKMLAKEAQLGQTIHELDQESRKISGSLTSSVKEMIKEANETSKDISSSSENNNQINPSKKTSSGSEAEIAVEKKKLTP